MPEPLELARRLLKEGRIEETRQVLEPFLKENRTYFDAWWLYAGTWPEVKDKKRVWEYCLRYNPGSVEAKRELAALSGAVTGSPAGPQRAPVNEMYRAKKKTNPVFVIFSGCAGLLVLGIVAFTVLLLISQPDNPAAYRHSQPVEYYLYVPKNYSPDREWPVFVGIHGSGGSGLECWNLWQPYAKKEGFILLCPSIPGDGGGYYQDVGENTVWNALGAVKSEYRLGSRMFLAGFSAGAYFVQGFTIHYPQAVSGLSILSTGYFIPGIQTRVPILVAIGGADHPDSIRANEALVSYLSQNGFEVYYQVFPGVGHMVTSEAKNLTIELFKKVIGR